MPIFLFSILDFVTGQKWRYGRLRTMFTAVPNFVTVSQPAAELLRFVEKFKMAASVILNLYLAILVHQRSPLMDMKCTANLMLIELLLFKIS